MSATGTGWLKQELTQGHWGAGQRGQFRHWQLQLERVTELNCIVMAGELIRTSAITLPCASWLKIVRKRRQTSQLPEEPNFLKLPSTATSRSDQTEALEASQWCQASTSASLAISSWCQQRNKALFKWGWSRVEMVPPCCRAVPKRCSGDHSGNSKGTGLDVLQLANTSTSQRNVTALRETCIYFSGHIYHAEENYRVCCACLHLHSAVLKKGSQAYEFV